MVRFANDAPPSANSFLQHEWHNTAWTPATLSEQKFSAGQKGHSNQYQPERLVKALLDANDITSQLYSDG